MKNDFRFIELNKRGNKLAKRLQCANSSIHYLSILEGTTRGKVYISEGTSWAPTLAIVYSFLLGGFQIMGDVITKPEEYAALRLLFERKLIPDLLIPNGIREVSFSCDSEGLHEVMRLAFFDRELYEQIQLCYSYSHTKDTACFNCCSYPLRRIDPNFAANNFDFKLRLHDEILESYVSMDSFFRNGLAYIALDGDNIIANLIANGRYGNCLILGADTDEEYRQQGIAASLLLSAAQYARAHELDLIWECAECNIASVKTAEKCGFQRLYSFPVRWFEI